MQIITPPGVTTVSVVEAGHYVTLAHQGAELTIPTLPRPGNYSETIYLVDGALQFEPADTPIIAAVFASHAGSTSLTLYPLTAEPGA